MTLAPGMRIGAYEIVSLLGEGGMGAVYRARDSKLKREVAIKVLPANVAADGARLARFQREAEVLAALNHPHIAGIYGLEDAGGTIALVMELVEGEDLSQRIARGAMPLDEALPIARQIAEALEAAHEQGIVHRDLKPANIKVRPDGTVKVLDFGLAKAMDPPAPANGEAMQAATITTPAMTQAGMILGTAAYMSPEQAKGRPVDKRADIWAFGAVLYEMLTGRRAFEGEDIAEVLSRVLQREPDLAALPAATPPRLRELIARCLIKDPKQRLRDIGDARFVLDGAFETGVPSSASAVSPPISRGKGAWLVAAAALLLAAALGVPAARHLREVPPAEMRFELVTPPTSEPQSFALSPDGRRVVFVAEERGGAARLWLRPLGSTAAQPIAGTDEATLPFWSPDGRSIGFFAGGQLKRLDLASGATRALAAAQAPSGGSWNADGVILFARAASPILRVSADGGEPRPATTLGSQNTHRFPVFLPDGQHFLFYIRGGGPAAGVFLGALDGASQTRLTAADVAAAYLPSGWVLWKSGGALLAQRLDVQGRALTGPQVTVADGLVGDSGVSTSASGLIAYRSVPDVERQLVWYNRAGERLGTVGAPETGLASELRVAPDGRRVATARSVAAGQSDIWLLDGSRSQRVTSDDADDKWPVWAPDGERVAFSSTRPGVFTLYARRTDGTTPEQPLLPPGRIALPNDWSHDGRFLLYASAAADGRYDLLVHPMVDGVLPGAVVQSAFNEAWARFSPDDRWIAYQSGRPAEDWPLPVPERGRA